MCGGISCEDDRLTPGELAALPKMSIRAFYRKCVVICLPAIPVLAGCELGTQPQVAPVPLAVTFRLADSTGQERRAFHPGESFDIAFSVTNMTPASLTFTKGDTGPDLRLYLLRGDSIAASSVDGYAFAQVVTGGYLDPGDSLNALWRAPNTPARDPKIVLGRGLYEIRASLPYFHEIQIQQVFLIGFVIVD